MDQLKHQNIASSLTQSIKAHHNLFKLTQLLVSLSVCSFIFSPSSLLVFLHYFKFYFSTFPFQLFTHNIDKNCMFLLCNGLLVFLGITRSFSGSSGDDDQPSKHVEDGSRPQFQDVVANEAMLEEEAEEKIIEPYEQNTAAERAIETKHFAEEVEENIGKIILVDEEQEEGSDYQSVLKEEEKELDEETEVFVAGGEEEEKGSEIDQFMSEENIEEEEYVVVAAAEEEEEEEEEENCTLSTEELNKKFDDFIRRMKRDLRIEAQRQLVMV